MEKRRGDLPPSSAGPYYARSEYLNTDRVLGIRVIPETPSRQRSHFAAWEISAILSFRELNVYRDTNIRDSARARKTKRSFGPPVGILLGTNVDAPMTFPCLPFIAGASLDNTRVSLKGCDWRRS